MTRVHCRVTDCKYNKEGICDSIEITIFPSPEVCWEYGKKEEESICPLPPRASGNPSNIIYKKGDKT